MRKFIVPMLLAMVSSCGDPVAKPDWITDSKTGCKVWNEHPQNFESISWSGNCTNNLAQGQGVLQWYEGGGRQGNRYEGEFKDGKTNGRGVYTWLGGRYEGEFKDNNWNGRGVLTQPHANFEGEFKDGQFDGRGVYILKDQYRYEGEWKDGKRNGQGVMTFASGGRYAGEFKDGKPNGIGTYAGGGETVSGSWTNGCFREGERRAVVNATARECKVQDILRTLRELLG